MSGWSAASGGWTRVRRRPLDPVAGGRWSRFDVIALVVAFALRWELGLAFLALKLWHQASGSPLTTLAFAGEKWDQLVRLARDLGRGGHLPVSLHVGPRSSGSPAFDRWRQEELVRIDAERAKLAAAENDFARYRDELVGVKDREEFERFMRGRSEP